MKQIAKPMDISDLRDVHWDILEALKQEGGLPPNLLWEEAGIKKSKFYYNIDALLGMDFVEKPTQGFYQLGDSAPLERIEERLQEES